jgi:hypothetical protein
MLVLHCCFHVYLAHRLHDEFQVSSLLQHASAEVMPATIQDQLLRQTGLRSSLPELERHRSQMSRTCSFRWERLAHAFHKQNDGCPSALMVSTSRPAFAIAAASVAAFLCLAMPLVAGRFTIGLRLLKLHPLSRQMTPLKVIRAIWYALMLLIRFAVLVSTIALLISVLAPEPDIERTLAVRLLVFGSVLSNRR